MAERADDVKKKPRGRFFERNHQSHKHPPKQLVVAKVIPYSASFGQQQFFFFIVKCILL
jgi:hypothetical protein